MQNLTGLVLYRLEKARKGEDVGGSYIRKYKTKGGNTRYIYARDLKGSGGKVSDLGQIKVSKTYKTPGTIYVHNDKRYKLGEKQSSGKYKMVEVDNTGKRIGTEFAVSDKTLDRMTRSQVHLASPGKAERQAEIEARMPKPEPVNTTTETPSASIETAKALNKKLTEQAKAEETTKKDSKIQIADGKFTIDFPWDSAREAHRGTSHTPDRRADQELTDTKVHLENTYEQFKARGENRTEDIDRLFSEYAEGYMKRKAALYASRHGLMSTLVTGPANFPVKRMEKKNLQERKALDALLDWSAKFIRKANKELTGNLNAPIRSGDSDAVKKLQAKIDSAKERQEMMKSANKVVRNKKLSDEQKIAKIVDLGWAESTARKLLEPDFAGRLGFPGYETTNNLANIKRMEGRIVELQREASRTPTAGPVSTELDGHAVEIHENEDTDRIGLKFEGKPSSEVRAKLKSNGFRWAPSVGLWQRQRNQNTRSVINRLMDVEI